MSNEVIIVDGPEGNLGGLMLEGKLVSYHDSQFEMTTGDHEILMKLLQEEDGLVIFYLHVPYAYPMPEGVKQIVTTALESALKKKIQKIEFINAGTETQKRDIHFRMGIGGGFE